MVIFNYMQAVILAGGKGTRLSPITDTIPKPMAMVNNRPFLEYMLLMLKRNSFKKILLCVGYLGEKIEAYFGDGNRLGIVIKYSYEKELLGTAGALKLAENILEEEFLVLYGDSYLDIDYRAFIAFFAKRKTIGSIVIYDNAMGNSDVKSNISVKTGFITRYDKNAEDPSLNYVEAGASIFKRELLALIPENRFVSLENEIFPVLIKNKELTGYKSKMRFYDIGTLDRLNYFKGFKL